MEEKIKEPADVSGTAEKTNAEKETGEKPPKVKQDKLCQLKAKQEKAAAVLEKAAKKAKAIQEEIAAEERRLRDKEIKNLDSLCRNMKIELADVTGLIQLMADKGLSVSDIKEMIGDEKRNG